MRAGARLAVVAIVYMGGAACARLGSGARQPPDTTGNATAGTAAAFASRLFLEPADPYPWRYGDGPPAVLVRRRVFVPGEQVVLRFAVASGFTIPLGARLNVRLTWSAPDGTGKVELGETTATGVETIVGVATKVRAVDGRITLRVPDGVTDGTYQVLVQIQPHSGNGTGNGNVQARKVPVYVRSAYPELRARAVQALARAEAAAGPADAPARAISLPSLQMLVEDADIVWNDFVEPQRDWTFVKTQLETAAAWAERLAAGDDPYRAAKGTLIKAYRSGVDQTLQPYAVRVPAAYDKTRSWPLVIQLHGAYANHRFDIRRVFGFSNRPGETDHEATRNDLPLPEVDMLVVAPYGRGELHGYAGLGEDDVLRVLDDVSRAYNIDPDRVYLSGYSMGGQGVWQIGLHYPDRFAALAPVCGIVGALDGGFGDAWSPNLAYLASPTTLAPNASNLRVLITHGAADATVSVEHSRWMMNAFARARMLGPNITYDELRGVGHAAWVPAYQDARLFGHLAGVRRDPFPRHVIYRSISPRYRQAYWLRIDRRADGARGGELDGEQDGHTFTVRPHYVAAFSVLLDPAHVPEGKAITVRVVDLATGIEEAVDVYRGPSRPSLSFARSGNAWRPVPGPVVDPPHPDHPQVGLFSKSLPRTRAHLYVYGTTGPGPVAAAARRLAERLANWGEGVKVHFEVRADRDVTDADVAKFDLVLVGGARVNALVARMAGALPISDGTDALVGGSVRLTAADRGYRLVVPNPLAPQRLVLIYGADTVPGLAHFDRFAVSNADYHGPESTRDYMLFDGDGTAKLKGIFKDDWRTVDDERYDPPVVDMAIGH